MFLSHNLEKIKVGARLSPLSQIQVEEVFQEITPFFPELSFDPVWIETTGDKDQKTSLRDLEKTDFFTKELDVLVLNKECRIAIHSAKDLPQQIPDGLCIAALTQGLSCADALVFRDNLSLATLPLNARIGTSSQRREEMLCKLRPDLVCVDIRGSIEKRLAFLDSGELEGLIVAEAALIRLKLQKRNRLLLPDSTAPLQGKLAVIARKDDHEMLRLFAFIDSRLGFF